jgi:MFS family permease
LRVGAWVARGIRVPARNALLADVVPGEAYGRTYGFERAMDNLGAIGGPLLALGLVTVVGVRTAIIISVIPGILAALAIAYAIGHAPRLRTRERRPLRIVVRPVMRGRLGRLMLAACAFEAGNAAATLLILRATDLLEPSRGHEGATQLALVLYAAYNLAATLSSLGAGRIGDLRGNIPVLVAGAAFFLLAYLGFAASGGVVLLAAAFVLAGVGIGCAETAEHAAVASLSPEHYRGSAFGLLGPYRALATSPPARWRGCSGRFSPRA